MLWSTSLPERRPIVWPNPECVLGDNEQFSDFNAYARHTQKAVQKEVSCVSVSRALGG